MTLELAALLLVVSVLAFECISHIWRIHRLEDRVDKLEGKPPRGS